MSTSSAEQRRRMESLERAALAEYQLTRLNELLAAIRAEQSVLCGKTRPLSRPIGESQPTGHVADDHQGRAYRPAGPLSLPKNLTWPVEDYVPLSPDVRYPRPAGVSVSTRPMIGSGGSMVGNMCSMRQRSPRKIE